MSSIRRFRPRWWAALVTLIFAAVTIHLGHWQGTRAKYKLDQQRQLDQALSAPPITLWDVHARDLSQQPEKSADGGEPLSEPNTPSPQTAALRYRAVTLIGEFQPDKLYFLDNKILNGKAGYGVLQLFRVDRGAALANTADSANANQPSHSSQPALASELAAVKWILVDRGWVVADANRSQLPQLETPAGRVAISGRLNLPVSRNPGTETNASDTSRLNYVNIEELTKRTAKPLETYMVEQTGGPGSLGTPRTAPAANYQKNLAYQVQWYAFAALAVILFILLSFKKEASS